MVANTNNTRKPAGPITTATVAALQPVALTVPRAVKYSGVGRTKMYHLIAGGQVRAVKLGRRTLVLVASLEAYVRALPPADIDPRYGKRDGRV